MPPSHLHMHMQSSSPRFVHTHTEGEREAHSCTLAAAAATFPTTTAVETRSRVVLDRFAFWTAVSRIMCDSFRLPRNVTPPKPLQRPRSTKITANRGNSHERPIHRQTDRPPCGRTDRQTKTLPTTTTTTTTTAILNDIGDNDKRRQRQTTTTLDDERKQ